MLVNNGVRILQAWFVETGTSPDMVSHCLITHVSPNSIQQFAECVNSVGKFDANNLAGIAGGVVQLDSNQERRVTIPNGFGTKRYRFVFKVGNPNNPSSGSVFYYTGYTDFPGWSDGVSDFANEMTIFFNNCIQVTQYPRFTPAGMVVDTRVDEASHLVHPRSLGFSHAQQPAPNPYNPFQPPPRPSLLRPMDLLRDLDSNARASSSQMQFQTQFVDTRTDIDICKSRRTNMIPGNYLSDTANALIYGSNAVADSQQPNELYNGAYSAGVGKVAERGVYSDHFLGGLMNEYGYHAQGCISWGDLKRAHPELMTKGVTFVVNGREAKKRDIYQGNASEVSSIVGDRSPQTMLVLQLMQSIPALLLTSLISMATIRVTNMTLDGSIFLSLTNPMSFASLPQGHLINTIPFVEEKIKHIIFNDLVQNKHIAFDAIFTIDIFGESFVSMSYNGEPHRPYSIPTYCDGLTTSVVTANTQVLNTISHDLNYLVTQACGV